MVDWNLFIIFVPVDNKHKHIVLKYLDEIYGDFTCRITPDSEDTIYYVKDNKVYVTVKRKYIWVDEKTIWRDLYKIYGLTTKDIQSLLLEWLIKRYDIKNVLPYNRTQPDSVDNNVKSNNEWGKRKVSIHERTITRFMDEDGHIYIPPFI